MTHLYSNSVALMLVWLYRVLGSEYLRFLCLMVHVLNLYKATNIATLTIQ
jgi:hypothetical protein